MSFWNFVKAYPWTFGVGGAILLTALVGVIYAAIVRPGDLGFMVRDGHELKWNRGDIPVPCFYAKDFPEEYLVAFERGRKRACDLLGFQIVSSCVPWSLNEALEEVPAGIVYLGFKNTFESVSVAQTRHLYDKRSGRILSAEVIFADEIDLTYLYVVALHELGHVIGLDHDRERYSVMYPVVVDRSTYFTSKDVDRLKEVYDPLR